MSVVEPPPRAVAARSRLLRAAVEAFAAQGFDATTTRDIATGAQMSPAAVYVHFRSKEEVLYELSDAGHRSFLELIDAADDPAHPPAARLRAVIGALAAHHARDHVWSRVVNYELDSLSAEHREAIAVMRKEVARRVGAIVDTGIARGAFDVDDPQATTTLLLSMGVDVARWYRESGAMTPEQIGDFQAEMAARIVGARADRSPT
ncbi:TetR/AcrR family transcriptional regulator [Gordonia hankookensis]|uniref:TetR/AcrR family transcriptional regulator n=1 Tax=Gordonia hankookensis TaxID=589403 RepID=A0ABR7WAQ5_9ACTN|nr:TetR/AcrR family transcriptional regulator [Gordonia hankookensis]MBD1319833.1 TetR/AcrR family transcriptional regulator [Gordonia hankookensis]NDZ95050.1 TetR/AcrR family transcriptional regulator [Streptomyces sp. SID11726]NEB24148.1 TetR/AcrR family transcriptional regulator [Streptomyces sp. SID6673]